MAKGDSARNSLPSDRITTVEYLAPSNIGLSAKSILLVEHCVLPNISTSKTSLKRKRITPPMK